MKTLVAYFSAGGITVRLAETLADAIGAHIHCINKGTLYQSISCWKRQTAMRFHRNKMIPPSKPELAGRRDDMNNIDVIFLGVPSSMVSRTYYNLINFNLCTFNLIVIYRIYDIYDYLC